MKRSLLGRRLLLVLPTTTLSPSHPRTLSHPHTLTPSHPLTRRWTKTIEPLEYVEFLNTLFARLAKQHEDGFYFWKELHEVEYGGYQQVPRADTFWPLAVGSWSNWPTPLLAARLVATRLRPARQRMPRMRIPLG